MPQLLGSCHAFSVLGGRVRGVGGWEGGGWGGILTALARIDMQLCKMSLALAYRLDAML